MEFINDGYLHHKDFSNLYNVAIVTPPNIRIEPIAINHDKAPEKYSGKNIDSKRVKQTDQNE